jgi:two-component system, LuxR family, response regulator FixJ
MVVAEKKLICIVDDDEGVRRAFRFLLRTYGFAVVDYSSPAALLESEQMGDCACFVLDVHMPQLSGLELLKLIRKSGVDKPAIIVTGRDDTALRKQAEAVGAVAFLPKPIEGDILLRTIDNVVGAAQTKH